MKRFKSICAKYLEALQIVFSDKRQTWVLRLFCARDLSTVRCYVCAKVDANLKKQVEGANLRASVTRCRWEDASTAELRVGAACNFFSPTFFRLFSSFTPFCLSPTSAADSDLVPNIELHDGKYIAIQYSF